MGSSYFASKLLPRSTMPIILPLERYHEQLIETVLDLLWAMDGRRNTQ